MAYSLIGLQELNLCYKYSPIYWSTANLICDSGAIESKENESTDYGKMGVAIATAQKENIKIELPLINLADYGFAPDENNNIITFGLKGINGIGDEVAKIIIENRPYSSIEDFCKCMIDTKLIKNKQMIQLIKGGCFTKLHSEDRAKTMEWYIRKYLFTPTEKLTMQQYDKLIQYNLIPKNLELATRIINFKKYVLDAEGFVENFIDPNKKIPKCGYHDRYYILDNNSQPFFVEHFSEKSIVRTNGDYYIISEKLFVKECDKKIQPLKDWFCMPNVLDNYNQKSFELLWNKHAEGNEAKWNMNALCYYDKQHELSNIQNDRYGIVDFFSLPEQPESYDTYVRYIDGEKKYFPKYKITRIAGTVLNSDNNHYLVTILTTTGIIKVKFSKGQYAFYNKQIAEKDDIDSNKKTIVEKSWFARGNKVIITGYRVDDGFKPKVYSDTIYSHTCSLINEIYEDGTLLIQSERNGQI